jgi:hypothetical protein
MVGQRVIVFVGSQDCVIAAVVRAFEIPRLETAVVTIVPVAEAVVAWHEGAALTEVDGKPLVRLDLGLVPGMPVVWVLDQVGGGTPTSIIIRYARYGGYHPAADVGVLESLGVAVGGDVVEGTVRVEGGGKLALVPCKKEEEKGGGK